MIVRTVRWQTRRGRPYGRRSGGTKVVRQVRAGQRRGEGSAHGIPPHKSVWRMAAAEVQQGQTRGKMRRQATGPSPESARSAGSGAPEAASPPPRRMVVLRADRTCTEREQVSICGSARLRVTPRSGLRRARGSMTARSGVFVRFQRRPACCQSPARPRTRRRRTRILLNTSAQGNAGVGLRFDGALGESGCAGGTPSSAPYPGGTRYTGSFFTELRTQHGSSEGGNPEKPSLPSLELTLSGALWIFLRSVDSFTLAFTKPLDSLIINK